MSFYIVDRCYIEHVLVLFRRYSLPRYGCMRGAREQYIHVLALAYILALVYMLTLNLVHVFESTPVLESFWIYSGISGQPGCVLYFGFRHMVRLQVLTCSLNGEPPHKLTFKRRKCSYIRKFPIKVPTKFLPPSLPPLDPSEWKRSRGSRNQIAVGLAALHGHRPAARIFCCIIRVSVAGRTSRVPRQLQHYANNQTDHLG